VVRILGGYFNNLTAQTQTDNSFSLSVFISCLGD
jgi:hypothetical protein